MPRLGRARPFANRLLRQITSSGWFGFPVAWTNSNTDNVGLADDISGQTSVASQIPQDNVGITETTSQAAAAAQTYIDSIGILELVMPASVDAQNPSESVGIIDSPVQVDAASRNITDPAAASVILHPAGVSYNRQVGGGGTGFSTQGGSFATSDLLAVISDSSDTTYITPTDSGASDEVLFTFPAATTSGFCTAITMFVRGQTASGSETANLYDDAGTFIAQVGGSLFGSTVSVGATSSYTLAQVANFTFKFTAANTLLEEIWLQVNYQPAVITDNESALAIHTAVPTDNIGITDNESQVGAYSQSPSDSVGITDTPLQASQAVQNPSNNVGLTDTPSQASVASQSPLDNVGVTDRLATAQGWVVFFNESLNITDVAAQAAAYAQSLNESVGLADAVVQVDVVIQAPQDNVGITDQMSQLVARTFIPNDNIGITDLPIQVASFIQALPTDNLGITDNSLHGYAGVQNPLDNIGITDNITPGFFFVRSPLNNVGITDTLLADSDFTSHLRVWTGTVWLKGLSKVWDGTRWELAMPQVWNGAGWLSSVD